MPSADFSRWPTVGEVAATLVALAAPSNRVVRGSILKVYGRSD
jgi:hypothetical protein